MSFVSSLPEVSSGLLSVTSSTLPPPRLVSKPSSLAPPYGKRKTFIPRNQEDFGDGGAYPEIHVLQYPMEMGRKDKISHGKVAALQVDEKGIVQYDALIRQGVDKNIVIYNKYTDLIEKNVSAEALARPTEEEEKVTAERTRAALEKKMEGRIKSAQPKSTNAHTTQPVYIRYTPGQAEENDTFNSGAKNRIIKLHEASVDPLEPAKHKHKKLPPGAADVQAPIMHSPPRKMTKQEAQNWKIPPCISNWKNVKGYTIPLDKRLAADGRGLNEVTLNDNFAQLAESLAVAEYKARQELSERGKLREAIAQKQKDQKDVQLQELARRAREKTFAAQDDDDDEIPSAEALDDKDERDQLRLERKRDREREARMDRSKKPKTTNVVAGREQERDISESIALGKQMPKSQDSMFDARLFNQSQGVSAGFGADDDYSVYSKPFALGAGASAPYRPTVDADHEMHIGAGADDMGSLLDTSKFKADRGFSGTDAVSTSRGGRSKPVEFEKVIDDSLGQFLGSVSTTSGNKVSSIGNIGQSGHMGAAGGGSGDISSRTSIGFTAASKK